MASKHDYRGSGGECKICGESPSHDNHYAAQPVATSATTTNSTSGTFYMEAAKQPPPPAKKGDAADPAQPHEFKDDGNGKCAICGKGASADAHSNASSPSQPEQAAHETFDPQDGDGPAPHPFQDDGKGQCKVCGQAETAPIHTGAPAQMGARWQSTLLTEGILSRDGRMIAEGATEWGALPLTLMGMTEDTGLGGHSGSQVTGQIQGIDRSGNDIVATGAFDTSDWAQNIQRLVQAGTMTGISVDLAPIEWRIEAKPVEEDSLMPLLIADAVGGEDTGDSSDREVIAEEKMDDMVFVVTRGELMGATVCPMPAFANAEIHLTASGQPAFVRLYGSIEMITEEEFAPETNANPQGFDGSMIAFYPTPDEAASIATPDGNPPESLHLTLFYFPGEVDTETLTSLLDDFASEQDEIITQTSGAAMFGADDPEETGGFPYVLLVDDPRIGELRAALAAKLDEAEIAYAKNHSFTAHITQAYDDPADFSIDMNMLGRPLSFTNLSYATGSDRQDFLLGTNSLTASAAGLVPEKPLAEWFLDPQFTEATPLTVEENGRVYGHAATWNVCHVGHSGSCIVAPHSKHDYAYFMLGEVLTEEGERFAVGQITLDTGHAPDSYGRAKTRAHYDDTGTAVADVVVGEDEHGIWVAGALRADATAGQVRKLRGAKISGDWRDVNGNLELVGLLAVNVPGFPVPRPKAQLGRTRGGDVRGLALVAAGIVGEWTQELPGGATRTAPLTAGALPRLSEAKALRIQQARLDGGIEAMFALIND